MINNKIIIWGHDNHNALGLLRQLGSEFRDIFFLVVGNAGKCATFSKYCKSFLSLSKDDGLQYLLTKFVNEDLKPILFLSGDEVAEMVDLNYNRLKQYFILSGTTVQGLLNKVSDKNYMAELANKHGFVVPKSKIFKWNTNLVDVSYPCILKPCEVFGVREFKYKVFYSEKELLSILNFLNHSNTYILQQYIPKKNDIVVYGCRLHNGEILLAGLYIKDRWSDDGGGSHGLLTGTIPSYINKECINSFLSEIDYYGLFSVEYGLFNGIAYFYEFNFRNDATSHLFYQAGANLPVAWVYDCLNIQHNVQTRILVDKWNINEIYDKINVYRGVITRKQWKHDMKHATIFYFYDKDDVKPWKVNKKGAFFKLIFRALLLKYRPIIAHIINKLKGN